MGLIRDDNDLCQSEFCQSLPSHTHVNKETSHFCKDILLSSKSSMDLLNRETQFNNIYRKVYRKVREANHRSLSYRNKYKLAKRLRVGQKVLSENHNSPFGKSQKICELRRGPYIVTKINTKVNYEIAFIADPTRNQLVQRNHLVEYFPRNNELPNLISNYQKPFNDDKTEHFYNEYAKSRPSQLNQPINTIVDRQYLNDYSPIFLDTCGPSRLETTFKLPVKDNSCHLMPNFLASSLDSGIPQSPPHTPLSFQSESPVITSQSTTPSLLPRATNFNPTNLPSTSAGPTPR